MASTTFTIIDNDPVNTAPVVTILAQSSYAAGTVLTGSQLFSVSDPQGASDIGVIFLYDANVTNGAVWRYNGSVITPGGASSGGFSFDYANRSLLTYTVGTGSNDFAIEAFDKSGANSVVDPVHTITGTSTSTNGAPVVTILAQSSYTAGTVLTGTQLFSVSDPQGSSDIGVIFLYDANVTNGAVWRYNGSVITPGGASSGGFSFDYANRSLLTYTVGTGSNDFAIEAFDKSGANSVVDPVHTITGTSTSTNGAPVVTILAQSSYTAGTVLTGSQLFSVSDPQGSSDIGVIFLYDANVTNGAVWRYNGSVITPGGASSGGFSFEYANRSLLTYTVGTGSNDFAIEAFDKSGANSVVDPVHTITGETGTTQADDYRDSLTDTTAPLGQIAVGGSATGIIVPEGGDVNGDKDFFKVDGLIGGKTYKIAVVGESVNSQAAIANSFFSVRDSGGVTRLVGDSNRLGGTAYDDAFGTINAAVEFTATTNGTHYISVGGGGANFATQTGGYRVSIIEVTEPGNSSATSSQITLNGGAVSGYVGYGADAADYYTFTPSQSGKATVNLTGLGADIDAVIVNGSGQRIDTLVSSSSTAEQRTAFVNAGQTYFIGITPHSTGVGAEQSPYTMTTTFSAAGTTVGGTTMLNANDIIAKHGGDISTLIDLAVASYDDAEGQAARHSLGLDSQQGDWKLLSSADLGGINFDGVFYTSTFFNLINTNAAAIVVQAADSLFVSIRGTDSLFDVADDVLLATSFYTVHYDKLRPLLDAVDTFASNTNNHITHIYITGHSLGGAMVDSYMSEHEPGDSRYNAKVTYEALTVATPGYPFLLKEDGRITNFWNEDDPIRLAKFIFSDPGDDNNIFFGNKIDSPTPHYHQHFKALYEAVLEFSASEIRSTTSFESIVSSHDNIIVPITSIDGSGHIYLGAAQDYFYDGSGSDTLDGSLGDDILIGAKASDTYKYSSLLAWGSDIIIDTGGTRDVIDIGNTNGKIALHGEGRDLIIKFTPSVISPGFASGGTIKVLGYFNDNGANKIEILRWNGQDRDLAADVASGEVRFDPAVDTIVGTGKSLLNAAQWVGAAIDASLKAGVSKFVDVVTNWFGAQQQTTGEQTEQQPAPALGADPGDSVIGKTVTMSGIVDIIGTEGNDRLIGDDNANELQGGAGNDRVEGGSGNDVIIGGDGEGDDTYDGGDDMDTVVYSSATQAIVVNLTTGQATGPEIGTDQLANIENVIGGSGDDRITGNAGANQIFGGAGADLMLGGLGDDSYVVDNVLDQVIENPGEGRDSIYTTVNYSLSGNVEVLTAQGGADLQINGNGLANTIVGNSGNNVIDGGAGADLMLGGLGDDAYVVDNVLDQVTENSGEGRDAIYTNVNYTLSSNVEVLIAQGGADLQVNGNDLANTIVGNSGNNVIDGGGGADLMFGGLGDDAYVVDNAGDQVTEKAGEGRDTVYTTANYTLSSNVEVLIAQGGADLQINGNALGNTVFGNSGSNIIDGDAGADIMIGGLGDDAYVVDNVLDKVMENAGEGRDALYTTVNYSLSGNVEVLIAQGAADLQLNGNALGNTVFGNSGNNVIDGGAGADLMLGGLGDDAYVVDNVLDQVTENPGEGRDAIYTTVNYTASGNVEVLIAQGSAGLQLNGNALGNTIFGNSGNNFIDGIGGADIMFGGLGDNSYVVDNVSDQVIENSGEGRETVYSTVNYTLSSNVEELIAQGGADLQLNGNALGNTIFGNSGNNIIDGVGGADNMIGGLGDDAYVVDNVLDKMMENTGEGRDAVYTTVNYSLSGNVEVMIAQGGADLQLNGNGLANTIFGNGGNNVIDGGAGADIMLGGLGDDSYVVDNVLDQVTENPGEGRDAVYTTVNYTLSGSVEVLIAQGGADLQLNGNALGNTVFGNSGNNVIDGVGGADTMIGGLGDDAYVVDNVGDRVIENAGEGRDTVYTAANHTLSSDIEVLIAQGGADLQLNGNALANTIFGNSGNNVIDGSAGADLMLGGLGDDSYVVDNVLDQVTENPGEGRDAVYTSVNYTLSGNVEVLTAQGGAGLQLNGNGLANTIFGNSGNNVIDGGAGADLMIGGLGDDSYVVDNILDQVTENPGEGRDAIYTTVNYTAPGNVEVLIAQGSADLQLNGNALDNTIFGNSGNNVIDGVGGADIMIGGLGNDSYVVDNVLDKVTENPGEGRDAVYTTVNYTLSGNVEVLIAQGNADLQLNGNTLDNTVFGNSGSNVIDGGAGADIMLGGLGDDSYVVDNVLDQVIENPGEGRDTIYTTVNLTAPGNVEVLIAQGGADLQLNGNGLANTVFGNSGNNVIDGGAGADILIGAAGNDSFVFRSNEANSDTVLDFAGNGGAAGDSFTFMGFGTAAQGATFTQIGATDQWQIHSGLDSHNESITLNNNPLVHASDFFFV